MALAEQQKTEVQFGLGIYSAKLRMEFNRHSRIDYRIYSLYHNMAKKNKKGPEGGISGTPALPISTGEQAPSKPSKSKSTQTTHPSTSALIICRNKYVPDTAVLLLSALKFNLD